ncbi:dipeptidase [Lysobacter silvisoli]|uniref:Peptidase M19 n=1 Tax=Lysobacter silvisoli TaxID=2293254 RepID=A0A371JWM8_9GAMM|nr:membrane dipeptidase [Lysobacter silvisoli]RDZ26076.1 peptidase M19 [Lysobacter silvisoli]
MDRRGFLIGTAMAAAWAGSGPVRAVAASRPGWAPYADTFAMDACGGLGREGRKPDSPYTDLELGDLRDSGLSALQLTVAPVGRYANALEDTVEYISRWNEEVARRPEYLLLARNGADFDRAQRERKTALVYGFQDTTPIGEDPDRIATFHRLGVRSVQLTYNLRNLVGDGCLEPADAGLSRYGRKIIEALNEQRIAVDLSHSGRRTALDAFAASKSPALVSHSGCAALAALPRNKTDEELRAMAQRGGVVGIYLMPFLRVKGQPMAADLIAHLEHAVNVCGEDHVGIGSDGTVSAVQLTAEYKREHRKVIAERRALGISAPGEADDVYLILPDLNHPRRLETLAGLLSARGHSDARIAKLLGGNFKRALTEIWG